MCVGRQIKIRDVSDHSAISLRNDKVRDVGESEAIRERRVFV